ncbi:hypothetical protein [Actinomadura rubrisoli]|uniref:Uncharacterized protein n=1 Tax=Actinomadura rubrisoli TaxID=2530368 RepID=A0A4R5C8Y3_9ACTN|nr:hypothetical protein [Actinomadura rubrisoli]TDD94640.1 hypothetical protein E1298_06560 [Actinomadura rubrisoli]
MVLAWQERVAGAVERLAGLIHQAVRRRQCGVLAAFVDGAPQEEAALAAVRVLGPDALAPALLAGVSPSGVDRVVLTRALAAHPTAVADRLDVRCLSQATSVLCAGEAVTDVGAAADWARAAAGWDWITLSRHLAWLAPMAWPRLCDAVGETVRARSVDVGRGLARAMLRRDYPTAARLVRWSALACCLGADPGLDTGAVTHHVDLCGGASPRTALHTELARCLAPAAAEGS